MTVKYATGGFYANGSWIKIVEIDRETEKSIWISGRRQSKDSGYEVFHESWEAARDHLLRIAAHKLDCARVMLQRAQDELGNIKGLKP